MAGTYFPAAARVAAGSLLSVTNAPSGSASASPRFPFPKRSRLLKRASFVKIQTSGRRYGCLYFTVTCLADDAFECAKAGLTTPRRLGNAVLRNRLRRRMREAIRHEIGQAGPGWGFVFHPRLAAADAPMPALRDEVGKAFRRSAPAPREAAQ